MQNLFELILSNLFFVVLIIGGLLSFFKRVAQGNAQQERQEQGPQSEKPGKIDWKEIFNQEANEQDDRPQQQQYEEEPVSFEPVSHEVEIAKVQNDDLQTRREDLIQRREMSRARSSSYEIGKQPVTKNRGLDLNLNKLSNKEAMKAVVWSEVLGKPRGRHPHQAFTQRSRSR
ncbi:hypothetical protein [Bacillus solitudinis]|uniref:hypothetical protein n=1 Tax=Bacillus solitudinis TaxID=2014074 RepID=UPI000C249006|nr:hypothetical protein [Bacillus solitudinis]